MERHTDSGMKVSLTRDRHGNLRVADIDTTDQPWAEEKRVRRQDRARQQQREAKYWHPLDS